MTPPIDKLRARIELTESGDGQWTARCPAHDDNRASLCIGVISSNGTLGVKCQAGCATKDVLAALGMQFKDLFPQRFDRSGKGEILKAYDYRTADGDLAFQVVRMQPKDFRQRRPKPGGGWIWSKKGCPIIPYRLPELLAADPSQTVFIVEGEKDCDALAKLGIIANTNAGGAGRWLRAHAKYLQGRNVVIIPDNDDAGREHARKVAETLQ